jgi:hypothetical protein
MKRNVYRNTCIFLSSSEMLVHANVVCFVIEPIQMWTSEVGITHLIFPHSYTCCRKKLEKLFILVAHHIYVLICCYHIITPTLIYFETPVIKQWKDKQPGNKSSNHYYKHFILSVQIIIVWHSKLSLTNSEKKEVLGIKRALK